MDAKIHIHIHVSDLNTSREFYQGFFGVVPVKQKNGYVKFLPEFAPINLALSEGLPAAGGRAGGTSLGHPS